MNIRAFEQYIGHLLEEAGMMVTSSSSDLARVDFMVIDPVGERLAIEVKDYSYSGQKEDFDNIVHAISPIAERIKTFILVTPQPPDRRSMDTFIQAFQGMPNDAQWFGGKEFTEFLGLPYEFNFEWSKTPSNVTGENQLADKDIANLILNRQLSRKAIETITGSTEPPETLLRLGKRIPVVVVLSDIKNFSLLVKATKPEDLNDIMMKYYRLARTLVWDNEGTLDKFIGDAVLAIFGYPEVVSSAPLRAVKFAADLIELGKNVLGNLVDMINESIETGTRVGIASGEISVLNIGQETIEISFVGDVINLAARLEHASEVNGMLIDNLSRKSIEGLDKSFLDLLALRERTLSLEEAKGQLTSIRAWQVSPSVVPYISGAQR